MITPWILMKHSFVDGLFSKSILIQAIEDLQEYEFDRFCNDILGFYEFLLKYEGKCLTENEKIKNLYKLPIVQQESKCYDLAYVNAWLRPIKSPVKILADILTHQGYEKNKFIELLTPLTNENFTSFCQEVRNLEYFEAINTGHALVDCSLAAEICEGLWWKVDYGQYR